MDRMLEDSFVRPEHLNGLLGHVSSLPLDIYHSPDALTIRANIPGAKPEEVNVSVTGDTLTIKGEIKDEAEVKREDYIYRERRFGTFGRSITLPDGLDTDKVEAKFDNGMLTLTIPKAEEIKPRQIKIKVDGVA